MKSMTQTLTLVSAAAAAAAILLVSCLLLPRGSQVTRNTSDGRFSLGFAPLNHTETETFALEQGDAIEVSLVVVRGRLRIAIGQDGQEPIYEGTNTALRSFQVTVPEDGVYTITVAGRQAEGSLSFQIHPAAEPPQ